MEYFVYVALLSEANEALPNLLDDAIPIFVQCADTGMDSEMRLRYVEYGFLMGFYNYITTTSKVQAPTNQTKL